MSFKILEPISHGKDGKRYSFEVGRLVPEDTFTPKEAATLLAIPAMEKVPEIATKEDIPVEKGLSPLIDLSKLTVLDIREFLEGIVDVDVLERYVDQESSRDTSARKTVTDYINRRINDLTGYKD